MVTIHDKTMEMTVTLSATTMVIWRNAAVRANMVQGVTIRWGRDRLTEEPRARSLSASILVTEVTAGDALRLWAGNVLTLSLGGVVVFKGLVDSVAVDEHGTRYLVRVTAVQATSWWVTPGNLQTINTPNTVAMLGANLGVTFGSNPVQKTLSGATLTPDRQFFQNKPVTLTAFNAWSAFVSVTPMTWPSWTPDLTKVWPTMWGTATPVSVVVLPGRVVHDLDQSLAVDMQDRPRRVELARQSATTFTTLPSSGTGWSARLWEDTPGSADVHPLVVPAGEYTVTKHLETESMAELLKAQTTAPRNIRVVDNDVTHLSEDETWRLFGTWETDLCIFLSYADKWQALATDSPHPSWHPIGGTLTLTPDSVTHDLTVINRPLTAPPAIPDAVVTWAERTGGWATATHTWKG